jgi:hypothetical protein
MKLSLGIVLLVMTLPACRTYDLRSRLVGQDGLTPPDQYARYGREQAQEIAIAREFAHAPKGASGNRLEEQAAAAVSYARTLPDVADVKADPRGLLLTVRFKSGWRTMVAPLSDGKRGAETVGLPAPAGARAPR